MEGTEKVSTREFGDGDSESMRVSMQIGETPCIIGSAVYRQKKRIFVL
ncbi:Protein CBG27050 [Caenorhabditis briggsae]|uniref:Protein CBG27050 n=1 Tax=Caenorhabditis briggsae TaxID=6238 RepID=B6IMB4_CAEBR|nr:Protein CBG27050 [Caenorhabditis briggsae]CAS01044.1 Protein CBG27050 [Caenorhabditis briggsae]